MKKIIKLTTMLVVVLFLVACSSNEETEEFVYTMEVIEVSGDVLVQRDDIDDLEAYEGMLLESGDEVSVSSDSYLRVLIDGDKYIYVKENSSFCLNSSGDETDSNTEIVLSSGTIISEIQEDLSDDSSYEVTTPNASFGVRGTIYGVEVVEEQGETCSTLYALEGYVLASYTINGVTEETYVGQGYSLEITSDTVTKSELVIEDINEEMFAFIYQATMSGAQGMCFTSYEIELEAQSRNLDKGDYYLLFVSTDVEVRYYYFRAGEEIDFDSITFENYNILGWYTTWNCEEEYSLTTMPEQDSSVYALLEKAWDGYMLNIVYQDGVKLQVAVAEGTLFSELLDYRSGISVEEFYADVSLGEFSLFLEEASMPAIDFYTIYAKTSE
ncbi:FecR domain-containing protein [Tannockella kyphosi]|uniref:FecR domain-containing protein n=1 Tax=Tannockella kyphosi TaxID=2899121 RepID=UPI002010F94D|nr:FecR domain-containing protein [Tannockella kyphosi]